MSWLTCILIFVFGLILNSCSVIRTVDLILNDDWDSGFLFVYRGPALVTNDSLLV